MTACGRGDSADIEDIVVKSNPNAIDPSETAEIVGTDVEKVRHYVIQAQHRRYPPKYKVAVTEGRPLSR